MSFVFVVSGPSGSGKSTLVREALKGRYAGKRLVRSVSATTRPKRPGEISGTHYFFLTEDDFKKRVRAKKILEWTRYSGYYYGTPLDFIERQIRNHKNLVLCLDRKGARALKRLYPRQAVTVFILPPSIKELKRRIDARRCKTAPEEIKRRLRLASKEAACAKDYDHRIANINLAQALKQFKGIISRSLFNQ